MASKQTSSGKNTQAAEQNTHPIDPVAFSQAIFDIYEQAQPIFERAMQRYFDEDYLNKNLDPMNINPVYAEFMEKLLNDPDKFWQMQSQYWSQWFELWQTSTLRFLGDEDAMAKPLVTPSKGDRRFRDEDWQNNVVFDFLKQSYLLTCNWIDDAIANTDGLDNLKKDKLAFTAKLYANAMSPSNFAMTNPEVLRETIQSGGKNLIKGFENLIKDIERGDGLLQISTTDYSAFDVGENLAVTKGSVIYQNDLIQLIQYEATTDKVHKRPLLVVPPWINKYYILDMKPENSFIKWACDQGHSVFVISWVNPDAKLSQKGFEDYMEEGVLAAMNAVEAATEEEDLNIVGYCLGGTLLSMTLSYLKSKNMDKRVASATFLTTLLDFDKAGELKLFLDPEQIEVIDRQLEATGLFDAQSLQQTFKLLRSNDLIWSFVVNNYLMGREPFPFDLLYWNDDSTNMPAKMQRFYLKNMYRDNLLMRPGGVTLNDTPIDLSQIDTPSYFLSTKEDHIAPWLATYDGAKSLNTDRTFTLAASGHIAGVVNPPAKNKYCYWTNKDLPDDAQAWLDSAEEHAGSWWPHWHEWAKKYAGKKVPARSIKKSLEPAPGSYVKMKA